MKHISTIPINPRHLVTVVQADHLPATSGGTHGLTQLEQIFEHESRFDWEGHPWDSGKPKPPTLTGKELSMAMAEVERLEKELQPADGQTKAAMLYKLQGHYYQPGMTDALLREVAKDYIRLLDGYSAAIMHQACDEFLLDPEQRFFPKVGELKTKMDSILYLKRRRLRKLMTLIGKIEEN